MKKEAVNITVTGAAGQISYALLFRIASGQMLGDYQPIHLNLLEVTNAMPALRGVAMELEDCAFPLLSSIRATDSAKKAFKNCQYAFLVGARPRSKGMERGDLLEANAAIFSEQGRAINEFAHQKIKVLVVGNPANTNALITQHNAPNIHKTQITAMMRLDHNRAVSLLGAKLGVPTQDVKNVVVWGNHSATQFPDLHHATTSKGSVMDSIPHTWYEQEFIPQVQKRGAAIIEARGLSSAASAANAAICHMRDWVIGSDPSTWISMGVSSDGSYGIEKGLVYSFPCHCRDGQYEIVQGLNNNDFSVEKMQMTEKELQSEKAAIKHLLA